MWMHPLGTPNMCFTLKIKQVQKHPPSANNNSSFKYNSLVLCRVLELSGTFCAVSMVIARPFGTRPAVLCFFTRRTETTGMQTCSIRDSQLHLNMKKSGCDSCNIQYCDVMMSPRHTKQAVFLCCTWTEYLKPYCGYLYVHVYLFIS